MAYTSRLAFSHFSTNEPRLCFRVFSLISVLRWNSELVQVFEANLYRGSLNCADKFISKGALHDSFVSIVFYSLQIILNTKVGPN